MGMAELSTSRIAFVLSTAAFQPEMVPSSVAKMKMAGAELPFAETVKSDVPLKAIPVGAACVPGALPAGGGMVTTSGELGGKALPAPLETVDTPAPLSAIQ